MFQLVFAVNELLDFIVIKINYLSIYTHWLTFNIYYLSNFFFFIYIYILTITKTYQCFTITRTTVHCKWIHCELHCLVGSCVRLHLVGPKCQAGGPLGLRTRSAWALAWGLDTHRTHVALGLPPCVLADQAHKWGLGSCLSAGHTTAHTWYLGCVWSEPCMCPTWGHLELGLTCWAWNS
jgi:hypothetical protein